MDRNGSRRKVGGLGILKSWAKMAPNKLKRN